jgi:hypothetical protein
MKGLNMMTVHLETDLRAYPARYTQPQKEHERQYPQTLAEAVEIAVDQVDANCLRPVANADAGPAFQARTMLGLLAYCYARQVYSSGEIAAQFGRELKPFWVNDVNVPDALMLQRFRAENRGPLTFCLRSVLLFLAEEKIRQGVVTHVKRAHMHQEASRRIIMAMFTDNLEAPEENSTRGFSLGFGVAVRGGRVH